jgi:hypothetical protein
MRRLLSRVPDFADLARTRSCVVPARTLVEMKSSAGESCQRHLRFDQRFYFFAAATFTRTCSVNGRA